MVQKGPNLKIAVKKTREVTDRVDPPVGSSMERKNEIRLRRKRTPMLITNLSRVISGVKMA
jgi:hypothetical protein